MRNDRLKAIDGELATIRKRLGELQAETISELTRELSAIQAAVFNAKTGSEALASIAALLDIK